MKPEDAKKVVSAFQERLQDRLFEIENKVDGAVVLLAGGAFTVSLAIVPTLDSPLGLRWALVTAWASWASCLLVDLFGHMTSAAGHRRMLKQLSAGNFDSKELEGGWHRKAIPWLNRVVFALLVSGFVAFGAFVLDNLTFGEANEEGQTQGRAVRENSQNPAQGQSEPQAQTKSETANQAQGQSGQVGGQAKALREQPAVPSGGLAKAAEATPVKEKK